MCSVSRQCLVKPCSVLSGEPVRFGPWPHGTECLGGRQQSLLRGIGDQLGLPWETLAFGTWEWDMEGIPRLGG